MESKRALSDKERKDLETVKKLKQLYALNNSTQVSTQSWSEWLSDVASGVKEIFLDENTKKLASGLLQNLSAELSGGSEGELVEPMVVNYDAPGLHMSPTASFSDTITNVNLPSFQQMSNAVKEVTRGEYEDIPEGPATTSVSSAAASLPAPSTASWPEFVLEVYEGVKKVFFDEHTKNLAVGVVAGFSSAISGENKDYSPEAPAENSVTHATLSTAQPFLNTVTNVNLPSLQQMKDAVKEVTRGEYEDIPEGSATAASVSGATVSLPAAPANNSRRPPATPSSSYQSSSNVMTDSLIVSRTQAQAVAAVEKKAVSDSSLSIFSALSACFRDQTQPTRSVAPPITPSTSKKVVMLDVFSNAVLVGDGEKSKEGKSIASSEIKYDYYGFQGTGDEEEAQQQLAEEAAAAERSAEPAAGYIPEGLLDFQALTQPFLSVFSSSAESPYMQVGSGQPAASQKIKK